MVEIISKIKVLFRKVCKADIVKVFSFTAISTLVRMLTGLISVKVVAIIIGPSGIALLGQLNSFASIVMTGACGGINSGVTKYVAEYKDSSEMTRKLLSTAFKITLICSFIMGILMLVFHTYLSNLIMNSSDYGYVFVIFGCTLFLYALNMLLASILNGFKEFKRFVSVNIAGSILGLIFTLCFVFTLGLKGAMISAVTFQSVMFFISLYMVRKLPWVAKSYFSDKFDKAVARKYFRYTLMTFISAATAPVSQLVLRGYVISQISPVEAGWWEAMNRISAMYLMVITSSFGVYYLPRLSELTDPEELRKEMYKAYKIIMPVLVIGLSLVYFLRIIIIKILFTDSFIPMGDLFIWQLLGDLFKIASWLLAYLMLAKSMTKAYITTEILFTSLFVVLGFLFMSFHGVIGITQAYAVNYFLYFVSLVFFFRKILFKNSAT